MSQNHVHPLRSYLVIFGALIGLTAVTVGAAYLDFGSLNVAVALAIAMVKMMLVVLFFMHVKDASKLIWIAAAGSIYWLLIFFGLLMSDYLTRNPVEGWAPPIAW